MEGRCERHNFDRAIDLCGRCGGEYCSDCLVYPFGPRKPPFCLPCAVSQGGVRSSAATYRALSGRKMRQLQKQRKAALVAAQGNQPPPPPPAEPESQTPEVAAFADELPPATYEWFPAAEPA